jgi:RimJ/RimL family protein N-acetyltransferase
VKAYLEAQRRIDPYVGPEWFSLVVDLKAKEKVIGQVSLGVVTIGEHRQGTIGWLLGRKHQGQGLAPQAARAVVA